MSLGNKSSENRLIKEKKSFTEAGNHPLSLSDGEGVDSLLVQVIRRLRQDLNMEDTGVFDILLH